MKTRGTPEFSNQKVQYFSQILLVHTRRRTSSSTGLALGIWILDTGQEVCIIIVCFFYTMEHIFGR